MGIVAATRRASVPGGPKFTGTRGPAGKEANGMPGLAGGTGVRRMRGATGQPGATG